MNDALRDSFLHAGNQLYFPGFLWMSKVKAFWTAGRTNIEAGFNVFFANASNMIEKLEAVDKAKKLDEKASGIPASLPTFHHI
ncbi:MAG: hypothetical protein PHW87_03535 [Methanothrix sp.]|nr:hypothetical protein [Methanothrix sp.]